MLLSTTSAPRVDGEKKKVPSENGSPLQKYCPMVIIPQAFVPNKIKLSLYNCYSPPNNSNKQLEQTTRCLKK
eukprot:m.32094 g.32094  ORF g.32094 m.32094 type:complete len:72 (+) comp9756_c0_seq1:565-780(+)